MTSAELATLLHARRIGRDKYVAFCPVHEHGGRHRPSLYISDGKRVPVVMKCMSQGCSTQDILAAIGLSWKDVCSDRPASLDPAIAKEIQNRSRWEEWEREWRKSFYAVLTDDELRTDGMFQLFHDSMRRIYWRKRYQFFPDEKRLAEQRQKVHEAIARYGWDAVIAKWEATERGQKVLKDFGGDPPRSMYDVEQMVPVSAMECTVPCCNPFHRHDVSSAAQSSSQPPTTARALHTVAGK